MVQPKPVMVNERGATSNLAEEVRILEQRLRDGEEMVRKVREGGGDANQLDRWESGWIKLLRQYELKCDRLARQLASSQTASPEPPGDS